MLLLEHAVNMTTVIIDVMNNTNFFIVLSPFFFIPLYNNRKEQIINKKTPCS